MSESPAEPPSSASSKLHWRWPVALMVYWSLLFLGTHMPDDGQQSSWFMVDIPHFDKLIHFGGYMVLTFILTVNLAHRIVDQKRLLFISLIIVLLYAAIDETTQQFVAGRQADIYDWLADAAGAVVGVLIYLCLADKKQRAIDRKTVRTHKQDK